LKKKQNTGKRERRGTGDIKEKRQYRKRPKKRT
jgi:hypothetical protein